MLDYLLTSDCSVRCLPDNAAAKPPAKQQHDVFTLFVQTKQMKYNVFISELLVGERWYL